jgi:FkbM family methyltransferase
METIDCNDGIELPNKTYIANEFHNTKNLSGEQLSLIKALPLQVILRAVYSLIVHYANASPHHIEQHGKETVKLVVGERDSNGKYNGTGYDSRFEFEILANDEYIRPALAKGYLFDKYNIMAVWSFVKEGDTVIDVGANIGTFCVPIATAVGETGRVYAFEPQKRIFSLLKNNIKLNHASQIIPINAAAGHNNCAVNLSDSVPDGKSVGQSLKEIETSREAKLINYGGIQLGKSGEKCRMLQLDRFIDKESATNISLIKVDVEGAEPLVLYGAKRIIKKYRPVILFEKNFKGITEDMRNAMHLNAEEANFDILNYCRKIGYSILVILPKENFMIVYSDNNKLIEHSDVYVKQNKSKFNAYGYTVYFYKKKKSW